MDAVWPDVLVSRWEDLAGLPDEVRGDSDGRKPHVHVTLMDVQHMKVMNHAKTMETVFREVGVAAAAAATAVH